VICAAPLRLEAGGSGLNTAVIINQASSNSCELANYFIERRQVPPENVLRINWPGGNVNWAAPDFQTNLLNPLLAMLPARQLTNQIDYVVLSMDIPFSITNSSSVNSTTSALFYGLKGSSGLVNSYAGSEQVFAQAKPDSATGYSFLATMITENSVAEAKYLVDQGVNSDGTFPGQAVILAKSSDALRNIRYPAFDSTIVNTRLCQNYLVQRTNLDSPSALTNLLGFETGLANFYLSPNVFVPGAIADSMTSYAGLIFGGSGGQTTLFAFIEAGAAGSYGTVTEPTADTNKFPAPQVYFYQARGFSLAECYYQSLTVPYEGLIVGEPLAAPCARPATGNWSGISSNAVLSGTGQLSLQFFSAAPELPLQQIDLFVDGKYFRTLTNVAPLSGNRLNLTLNGNPVTYTVPANATLASVASGVAALVNTPATTNVTRIVASAYGDRVELRSTVASRLAAPMFLGIQGGPATTNVTPSQPPGFVSSTAGTASSLSTYITASRITFLDSPVRASVSCNVNGTLQVGDWLQVSVVKVSGAGVNVAVTNQSVSGTPYSLAGQLVTNINATVLLQGPDGVSADNFVLGAFSAGVFDLVARTPGLAGAAIKVTLTGSSGFVLSPSVESGLTGNFSDLQPRNHLYIRGGSTNLGLTFPLDTTTLADGFHDLTAVAYEGSSVRTQARVSVPVQVQNSALSATLTLLDLAATNSVQGTYHIQVTANTNAVRTIQLFSTGGQFDSVTNQSSATFAVNGTSLGVGLHPFYALVQTTAELSFRTQPQWARLIAGP
jgi:uncharacterized protein (TIGR03790 family)